MKTKWNDTLMQLDGKLYFADSNLSSYDLKFVNGSNVDLIGYSEHIKNLFVRFNDGRRFIYKDVPKDIFLELTTADIVSVGACYNRIVKGFFRYEEIDYWIIEASATDICKHYRNMQYNLNTSLGCYLTDRPDLIERYSASENILWEFEFQEQPDCCTRIK